MAMMIAAGVLVANVLLGREPAGEEAQPPLAETTPVDSEPGPEPEPERDPVDPVLAELRATDRFVAFAEHDRAEAAWADGEVAFGWNNFAVVHDKQVTHEWTNKTELWDEVIPPIRDQLLMLGEPYTEPMWDEERPSPASIGASWPDEVTGGRGQYVEITGRYFDEERGTPVERNWAVLIATGDDGSGELVGRMPPIELVPSQARNFRHADELVRIAAWEWVQAQPVLHGGGA
ncbi:MAG TPA: hypothetical protein VM324_04930 [Egibacteraceae bacterium]|nr:hypothetical protein [Egibacteraceae bacterium]